MLCRLLSPFLAFPCRGFFGGHWFGVSSRGAAASLLVVVVLVVVLLLRLDKILFLLLGILRQRLFAFLISVAVVVVRCRCCWKGRGGHDASFTKKKKKEIVCPPSP